MKTNLIFSTSIALLTLSGCKSDDEGDRTLREDYRETVIYRETMAPSVRSQSESFTSSGAVGSSAGVTNNPARRPGSERIYLEGAGANQSVRGSSVNPTEVGDRLYRDTSVQGQILNESAGGQATPVPIPADSKPTVEPTRSIQAVDAGRPATERGTLVNPNPGDPNSPLSPNRILQQSAPPPIPGPKR